MSDKHQISDGALDTFIHRMAGSISALFITEASKQSEIKDVGRLKRYRALKEGWVESSLLLDNAISRVTEVNIGVSVLPAIIDNQKQLSAAQTTIEALGRAAKDASLATIAKDFDPKFEQMRELSDFKKAVADYQSQADQLTEVARAVSSVNLNDLRNSVDEAFRKTDEEISRLQAEYRTDFSLEDDKFQSDLKTQRQAAIERLIKQRDQIERQWNEFCFALTDARHNISLLARSKDYTLLTSNTFLDVEEMFTNLRHTRKWTTNRRAIGEGQGLILGHEEVFKTQSQAFLDLSAKLTSREGLADGGPEQAPAATFYDNCKKALIPEEEIQALQAEGTEAEAGIAGLTWSSEAKKAETMVAFKEQKERLAKASLAHNKEVRKGYEETLVNILNLTRDELNTMSQAVAVDTHDYDDRFNQVYFRMTKASRYVGAGVSAVAGGLSGAASSLVAVVWGSKVETAHSEPLAFNAAAAAADGGEAAAKRVIKTFKSPLVAANKL